MKRSEMPLWERVYEAVLWEHRDLMEDPAQSSRAAFEAWSEVIDALESYDPADPWNPDASAQPVTR